MWPSIKLSRRVGIHFAMLVITSVIWSFGGGPKNPVNSILKIHSLDQGISEKNILMSTT